MQPKLLQVLIVLLLVCDALASPLGASRYPGTSWERWHEPVAARDPEKERRRQSLMAKRSYRVFALSCAIQPLAVRQLDPETWKCCRVP